MEVIAKERGYYGGELREVGSRFVIEDEVMNDEKRRPSWVRSAKFGGKGDHDDDGVDGGSKPTGGRALVANTDGITVPEGWEALNAKEKRKLADDINAAIGNEQGKTSNVKEAEDVISAYVGGVSKSAPFEDAPEPTTAQGTGVQEALGGTQPTPDWIEPSDDGQPVPADD